MSSRRDIRSFFTGKKDASSASTVKQTSLHSPSKPSSVNIKKIRTAKVKPPKLLGSVEDIVISESDGENPLPKSVRRATKTAKRKPAYSSEYDDDIPKGKYHKPTSPSPPKVSRKNKVLISSDSDASPLKKKVAQNFSHSSEGSFLISSDSEEDPMPKKRSRKNIPSSQTTLSLKKVPKSQPIEKSNDRSLKKISATDFFASDGTSKVAQKSNKSSPHKTRNSDNSRTISEENDSSSKDKQKKPVVTKRTPKKIIPDSEFNEIPDDVDNKAPKKNVSPMNKLKNANTKHVASGKSVDNEFVDSDEDIAPVTKKVKISPSSKENHPMKTASNNITLNRKGSTEISKPPTFIPGIPFPSNPVSEKSYDLPWVDKYKPQTTSHLVGQHGEKSPMNKLLAWLKDWAKHNLGENALVKKPKPAPWQQGGDGTAFKAALLSGTPGVGKTTCAYMACNLLGLKYVEMNASDVRNKKHLEAQVVQLTGSHQMEEYFGRNSQTEHTDTNIHHVLIMDEVDGMSGNEDRAGISELIQIIKETKIPILCICNDRSHPKIRSLSNYCYDLRFSKPRVEQIRGRLMTIAAQEKLKLDKNELDELIEMSGHDVRQTIYNLQMRSTGTNAKVAQKDCAINTFEAARKLMDSRSTWVEKQDMFYVDYGIMPLFVQENYLNMKNKAHSKAESLNCIRKAADLISLGDTVDRCIRSTGAWKLLNEEAMFSAIMPTIAIDGHLSSMIQFPSWLGKNSTAGKRQRLMRQLAAHAHLKISANTHSLVTDYVPALRNALTLPLLMHENDGIPSVVSTMMEYDLLKDDAEAIGELAVWPGKIDPASKIQSKVKAALTRSLNKEHRMLPYHLEDIAKGRRKTTVVMEIEVDEEGNMVEKAEGEEELDEENGEEESGSVIAKPTSSKGNGSRGARGGRTKK